MGFLPSDELPVGDFAGSSSAPPCLKSFHQLNLYGPGMQAVFSMNGCLSNDPEQLSHVEKDVLEGGDGVAKTQEKEVL